MDNKLNSKTKKRGGAHVAPKLKKKRRGLKAAVCIILVLAILYLTAAYSNIPFIEKWRTLYIETAMSTMSHQWLATLILPDSVIEKVMKRSNENFSGGLVEQSGLPSAPPSASVATPRPTRAPQEPEQSEAEQLEQAREALLEYFYEIDPDTLPEDLDCRELCISDAVNLGIKTTEGDAVWAIDLPNRLMIAQVEGDGYVGKLAIVRDSSQVVLGVNKRFGAGQTVTEFCDIYGAVLGVNASGFYDPDGVGAGDVPTGLVLENGEISNSAIGGYYQIAGYDYDDNFRVGYALDKDTLRHAMEFYPIVVLNGADAITDPYWMGIQPRTVIGQTADKTSLLLVVDGRQVGYSLGTTLKECAKIMLRYDAYTAMNMDGGSSSSMTYGGEMITKTSSPAVEGRYLPDAWLVMPPAE